MQSTVTEHAGSAFGTQSCQSCHMPLEDGEHSHAFLATRDPGTLRSALHVDASRTESDTVALTLSLGQVGHAFPTGDPFRRLSLELDAITQGGLVPIERRALTRTIETVRRGYFSERVETSDTRVGGADFEPVQRFDLGDARTSPVVWRVAYERLDLPFGHDEPQVFGRTVLFEGTLEAAP